MIKFKKPCWGDKILKKYWLFIKYTDYKNIYYYFNFGY